MPSAYTWPLLNPPTSEGSVSGPTDSAAALLTTTTGRSTRGILAPLTRGASDYITGEGAALINSAIRQVLGTRCSSATTQGELPWRTDFGALLYQARHRNNDIILAELLNQWTVDAIAKWLPSIRITQTKLERRKDSRGLENILSLRVWWVAIARGGQTLGSGDTSVQLTAIARA